MVGMAMKTKTKSLGFSLIELLVVIVIVGILSAIAVPLYINHQRQSYRSDAKAVLLEQARLLERYFTANNDYEDATLSVTTTAGGRYLLSFENANGDGSNSDVATYKVNATPQGGQAADPCNVLSIDNFGRKAPKECW